MSTKKIAVVLLIIAILFSVGTIWKATSADTGGFVPAVGEPIITGDPDDSDGGQVSLEILPPPGEGGA